MHIQSDEGHNPGVDVRFLPHQKCAISKLAFTQGPVQLNNMPSSLWHTVNTGLAPVHIQSLANRDQSTYGHGITMPP